MPDSSTTTVQERLGEVNRHYLLPIDLDAVESEIKRAIEGKPERIAGPTKVFLENINAAITTVTIPYTSAKTNVLSTLFRQLTIQHRILVARDSLTVENMDRERTPEEEAEQNKIAQERALTEFQNRLKDQLERERITKEWSAFLLDGLKDKQMETAAKELLRQAVVMVWGAFEVLCRDMFVGHLNNNPAEVQKLTLDSETRKIFQAKAIDLEVLSTYGFNVSSNLGDVFANAYDLSSLGAIRQTFSVLFPFAQDLHDLLRVSKFWILHQRRHLTVHKRAFVDKQYLEKTGEKIQIGQQLTSTPAEIEEYVRLVCNGALALVKAATKS
jgi:hypothetical protein